MTNVIPLLPPRPALPPGPPASLEEGMRSELVAALQRNCRAWGFDPGRTDGLFDANTAGAVRAMQRRLNVEPTGRIDKATRAAMVADLASPASVLRTSNPLADAGVEPTPPATPELPVYRRPWFLLLAGATALWFLRGRSAEGGTYDDLGLEDLEESDVPAPITPSDEEAAEAPDAADETTPDPEE